MDFRYNDTDTLEGDGLVDFMLRCMGQDIEFTGEDRVWESLIHEVEAHLDEHPEDYQHIFDCQYTDRRFTPVPFVTGDRARFLNFKRHRAHH